MVQYGFYYDNSRCTGCKTCVMACKDYKDSALDVAYRKVYDLEGGTWEKQPDDIYTHHGNAQGRQAWLGARR